MSVHFDDYIESWLEINNGMQYDDSAILSTNLTDVPIYVLTVANQPTHFYILSVCRIDFI